MQFFNQLGSMLGQDSTAGTGVQNNMGQGGIDYAAVLKRLGMAGMSGQDQQDMSDMQGISQLINLWGGGLGMGGGQGGM